MEFDADANNNIGMGNFDLGEDILNNIFDVTEENKEV